MIDANPVAHKDQNEVAISFSHSYYSYYRLESREFRDRALRRRPTQHYYSKHLIGNSIYRLIVQGFWAKPNTVIRMYKAKYIAASNKTSAGRFHRVPR